jgi:flavin reductase (DIM6/NTAB) family NADH-FMN oxidoreductase RutF
MLPTHTHTHTRHAQAANHTCGDYDRGVDEFELSGLTPVPSRLVKPPRVRESAVQLECRLRQLVELKDRCVRACAAGDGAGLQLGCGCRPAVWRGAQGACAQAWSAATCTAPACRSGKDSSCIVLADVVLFHIAAGVAGRSPTGKLVVDPVRLQPVCRLGGFTYGRVSELYDIGRPDKHGVYPHQQQQQQQQRPAQQQRQAAAPQQPPAAEKTPQ